MLKTILFVCALVFSTGASAQEKETREFAAYLLFAEKLTSNEEVVDYLRAKEREMLVQTGTMSEAQYQAFFRASEEPLKEMVDTMITEVALRLEEMYTEEELQEIVDLLSTDESLIKLFSFYKSVGETIMAPMMMDYQLAIQEAVLVEHLKGAP